MSLARRLLMSAGGSGGFAPPTLQTFTITSAPDGAWSWFGDPRVITNGDYSYIGYVDTTGNVCLRVYDHANESVGSEIVLKAAFDVDDHVNPSLAVLPNGKLAAWYCRHEPASTTPHQRISANTLASDPTISGGFGSETDLDASMGGTSYDYPVPIVVGSRVYLFFRDIPSGSSYRLVRTYSDDNGATWAAQTTLVVNSANTNRAYWKIVEAGGLIHFAWTDGSPNTDTTYLYHFYWDPTGDTYHETDSTQITASLPLARTDLTSAYTSANTWVWDIAVESATGYPRILHPTWATEFSDHRYRCARWNGSSWSSVEIAAGGDGIDATGVYSGGMCFDPTDPDVVYASRQVSGQWEMYRYVSSDSGATWDGTALTSSSSSKHIRPYVPPNRGTLRAVWLTGTYSGYTSFSMGVTGLRFG